MIVRTERKILFLVLTTEGYKDRQDNIIKTWGKDVDLIFYSEHEDKDRNVLKVCDENSAEIKQCKILNFLENYEKKYDWYFFCDDDTFVNVNLLNNKIIDFTKNSVIGKNIRGCWPTNIDLEYPSGGAGFLIHKSIISKFYNIKSYNTSWSDVSVGLKMKDENIEMNNSNLFMWFSYDREFVKLENVDKYITFHYINTFEKMNTLYEMCK